MTSKPTYLSLRAAIAFSAKGKGLIDINRCGNKRLTIRVNDEVYRVDKMKDEWIDEMMELTVRGFRFSREHICLNWACMLHDEGVQGHVLALTILANLDWREFSTDKLQKISDAHPEYIIESDRFWAKQREGMTTH